MNQDYVFSSETPVGPLPNLFIVADGMGGHQAGDFASKFTVNTVVQEISECGESDPERALRYAIERANAMLRERAFEDMSLYGMGTTVVAACVLEDEKLLVANVGDSRLYIVGDTIRQITKDHSLVEEMIRTGGIDRKSARNHPKKNVITRAVGAEDAIEVDFFLTEFKENELALMCTDGLTNMLEDEEIRMIIAGAPDIVEKTERLVAAANENGGRDNISVILISR